VRKEVPDITRVYFASESVAEDLSDGAVKNEAAE
jgi:hypothetical protein